MESELRQVVIVALLELRWGKMPQRGITTDAIVEALDVGEDVGPGFPDLSGGGERQAVRRLSSGSAGSEGVVETLVCPLLWQTGSKRDHYEEGRQSVCEWRVGIMLLDWR